MGGGDKGLLRVGGRPMLAHVIARLQPQVSHLALSANGDPTRFAAFGLPVIADEPAYAGDGPLAGLKAGLDWAARLGATAVVTVPADVPLLPVDLVASLGAAPAGRIAVATDDNGTWHPTVALWPLSTRPALAAALTEGRRRVRALIEREGGVPVPFADAEAFFNVNTPEDHAQFEAIVARLQP